MDSLEINEPTAPAIKHSGIGIASFVMSLGILIVTFVLVVIAGMMEASTTERFSTPMNRQRGSTTAVGSSGAPILHVPVAWT